jgi:type II secretory pathway component PulM
MGLRGLWAAVGNATALVLICVMFWQSQQAQLKQAAEDREMFRTDLRGLTEVMRGLTDEVRALRRERGGRDAKDPRP